MDSPLLRQLTPESPLVNGALRLEQRQWKELKADKEHSLYLTPAEVEAADKKGYVLKNGKFVPANKAVAKAWDHLNRGKDLQTYAQQVSEASDSNNVMNLYFDRSKPNTPTLRSLVLLSIDYFSYVYGYYNLNNLNGRLVGGSARGAVRAKTVSPEIVQPTLEQTLAVINNPDLNREGMLTAVSQLDKR